MAESTGKALFLSYASQDAEAARRFCDSLRSGGVEVWFDADGGLVHGDEWDAKIRRQIKECVLFIPVISTSTQARHEGYFRIEWELAAQRAMGIASGVPFILPVVIDDTREPDALVPDRFRMVQWTKLRGGEVPPEVQQRFLKLWSHRTGVLKNESANVRSAITPVSSPAAAGKPGVITYALIVAAAAIVTAGVGWWALYRASHAAAPVPVIANLVGTVVAATPPVAMRSDAVRSHAGYPQLPDELQRAEHREANNLPSAAADSDQDSVLTDKSVAVLAFADLSAAHDSEYFSDGISEELINALGKVPGLKVPARTSSFYFKGQSWPVPEIAKQLVLLR